MYQMPAFNKSHACNWFNKKLVKGVGSMLNYIVSYFLKTQLEGLPAYLEP